MNLYHKCNFQQEVLESQLPVLVDFWAPWCGPCKRLTPIIDEIAAEFRGKIQVGKLNIDEDKELADQYKVLSIPTLLLFEKGKLIFRLTGLRPKQLIISQIKKYIPI